MALNRGRLNVKTRKWFTVRPQAEEKLNIGDKNRRKTKRRTADLQAIQSTTGHKKKIFRKRCTF